MQVGTPSQMPCRPPSELGQGPDAGLGFIEELERRAGETRETPLPTIEEPASVPDTPATDAVGPEPRVDGVNAPSEPAPITCAEEVDQVGDAFTRLEAVQVRLESIMDRYRELDLRVARGELAMSDPEYLHTSRELHAEMMRIQMEVGNAQLGVELVSKVVDHGVSGVKTVLQTQA